MNEFAKGLARTAARSVIILNAGYESGFISLYNTIRLVSTALGALGIAGSGIQIITGDSQSAMKAKRRMIVIAMAVIAMYLVPAAIGAFKGLISPWDPGHLS